MQAAIITVLGLAIGGLGIGIGALVACKYLFFN